MIRVPLFLPLFSFFSFSIFLYYFYLFHYFFHDVLILWFDSCFDCCFLIVICPAVSSTRFLLLFLKFFFCFSSVSLSSKQTKLRSKTKRNSKPDLTRKKEKKEREKNIFTIDLLCFVGVVFFTEHRKVKKPNKGERERERKKK